MGLTNRPYGSLVTGAWYQSWRATNECKSSAQACVCVCLRALMFVCEIVSDYIYTLKPCQQRPGGNGGSGGGRGCSGCGNGGDDGGVDDD